MFLLVTLSYDSVLISGIFQNILSNHRHGVDVCLIHHCGGKKARDVGLLVDATWAYIMPGSFFYDMTKWRIRVRPHVFLSIAFQGCCGTCQYNLTDRMLRHDFNTTLNQSYVILISLVSMTYQSWGSVFTIYPFQG